MFYTADRRMVVVEGEMSYIM